MYMTRYAANVLKFIQLAGFLDDHGPAAEAQSLYIRELQAMEEIYGPSHKKTQKSRKKLERFLRAVRESYPEEPEEPSPAASDASEEMAAGVNLEPSEDREEEIVIQRERSKAYVLVEFLSVAETTCTQEQKPV
ncbi:hypothetical protein AK812_SmicGene15562 [Symbiodinium microadriaticum]|uniref:Uncharacterized protein n=1 Tax=Symbiodinium microadriaticum TaxID=2951 RepID=A0A1Q9E2N2_SYMMI|nr:hypothetical protein AK812_SmicGene15562 [Symbiodinium microadriaticum]